MSARKVTERVNRVKANRISFKVSLLSLLRNALIINIGLYSSLLNTFVFGSIKDTCLFDKITGGKVMLATGSEKFEPLLPMIRGTLLVAAIGPDNLEPAEKILILTFSQHPFGDSL